MAGQRELGRVEGEEGRMGGWGGEGIGAVDV